MIRVEIDVEMGTRIGFNDKPVSKSQFLGPSPKILRVKSQEGRGNLDTDKFKNLNALNPTRNWQSGRTDVDDPADAGANDLMLVASLRQSWL